MPSWRRVPVGSALGRRLVLPAVLVVAVSTWLTWPSPRQAVSSGDVVGPPSLIAAPTAVSQAAVPDMDGGAVTELDGCTVAAAAVRLGDEGMDVECLQRALIDSRYLVEGRAAQGTFDESTLAAVQAMQADRKLFVDGVVGRESARSLGIWPDEQTFVVRTPPPAAGAKDLLGYPLSSVASAGPDAPPLPANSGAGQRLVYYRAGQRVWAVDDDERVIRSWLVSGSKYSNELPGTHKVFSRSEESTAWNGKAKLPLMVRWLKTDRGAIGFHSIPIGVDDGKVYQTEAELGTSLSGGCQRQAKRDARFVWEWATIGTPVVVI